MGAPLHDGRESPPHPTQLKAMARAVEVLARHPERYGICFFDSSEHAHLFVALEAEALPTSS